jgi:hypothetical protein
MQKLFKKEKREKKELRNKWTQKCPRYLKHWGPRCLPKKKKKRDE